MSGEAAPRHIIRSQVTMKPYGQVCTQPSGRGKVGRGGWGNTQDTETNWGWCISSRHLVLCEKHSVELCVL